MPLSSGSRFGTFEIVKLVGAGAMGEVYRSHDTRLQREVALKVLPDAVALDSDRLARLIREAQVLASLNHPNIAAIHGVEQHGDRHALVLELVDGPTLAERIAQGPLPLDEALPIARQLAEALEAAHERGIVHRDLKPANIKLRPDGAVKVLDFGLAKAIARAESGASAGVLAGVTASPTLMSPATMTSAGAILGTPAYMAPEQVRGRPLDHRADIWAFGCVLFEMLAGRRAFDGEEVSDVLANVLKSDPRWHALPSATPPIVQRLLRRCLEKDPRERLQAIGDARLEIREALNSAAHREAAAPSVAQRSSAARVGSIAVASVATALIVGAATWMLKPETDAGEPAVTRALIAIDPFDRRPAADPGETSTAIRTSRHAIAVSPDGRMLAFRGNAGGTVGWQLYLRPLDRLDASPIPNTSGAENPFFSPDGAWLAFMDDGELRRAPAAGGPATTVARITGRIHGASWGDDDRIVFATGEGLWRVAASGGTPERISEPLPGEYRRGLPQVLPGADAILFTRQKTVFRWDDAQILVRSLSSGDEKVLLDDAADARYVASGHILFMRRGTLMAAPFDSERLALTGGAVSVVPDVMQAANIGNSVDDSGAGQFAVSLRGVLAYVTGGMMSDEERELVWVNRDGTAEAIPAPKREYVSAVRVSPDGTRILAFTSQSADEGGNRLWLYDVPRRTMNPVTAADERVSWTLWSPDGSRVAYSTLVAGGGSAIRNADGTGNAEHLAGVDGNLSSWSRDDRIALVRGTPTTGADIWVVDLKTSDRRPQPILQTMAEERFPAFSPDGKWLAYVSDEAGRPDVYIQPYPGPGPRVLVSPAGGIAPAWRGDGLELFYTVNNQAVAMHAVPITVTSSGLSVGAPRRLFEGQYAAGTPARGYDVTADGQRFVFVRTVGSRTPPATQLVLVENWFEDLRRLTPGNK